MTRTHPAGGGGEPLPAETDTRESGGSRIRVLWLIKGLGRGGAEMLLYQAARLRDRDAFECEVGFLLGSRDWLADDLRAEGVPVHLFSSEKHADFRWALKLRRYLIANPVDVVHVHSPLVAAAARLVVRSLPRRVRPRTVSTEHLPWSGHNRLTRMANAATFRLDAAHLAVSDAVAESIPRRSRRHVEVLVHGIPVSHVRAERRWRETVREELGVGPEEILVGTVANVTAQKAYPDLIEAAKQVASRMENVRFTVAGRGTLDDEMLALAKSAGLGGRLVLLGAVEDAPRFMSACDIFALASHWEGLPLVIMEAMALGLPVVATEVGGIPALIRNGDEGTLVPKSRPDLFARALEELAADPERRKRMGQAATEDAIRFDNEGAVRTIEALYRDVVERGRGRLGR
ncbi:MAG: glycosyltransferase [Actinomycetota bacterium]